MNRATTLLILPCLATLMTLLSGCSPHPATGTWTATGPDAEFSRLEVTYEGRANLFEPGETKAGRHCFWSGEDGSTVAMSCRPAFDPELEEHYRLTIGEGDSAALTRDGDVITLFSRAPS